ncbi:MAG: hypothetical protein AAF950_07185 [Pseudomonadota bacterium]
MTAVQALPIYKKYRPVLALNVRLKSIAQHDAHVGEWIDFLERASIIEFDGNVKREIAETRTLELSYKHSRS